MTAPVPWPLYHLLSWFGRLAVGVVTMLVAWWGVSGTTQLSRLILWVNIAVVGLTVTGLANLVWLLEGRRAVATRRRAVLRGLDESWLDIVRPAGASAPETAVASSVMTRYHLPDCAAVRGKQVEPLPLAAHASAGRTPCGICLG